MAWEDAFKNFKFGLSPEGSQKVFEQIFPELSHLSDESSFEEREAARKKLYERLGTPYKLSKLGWVSAADYWVRQKSHSSQSDRNLKIVLDKVLEL